ncbi:protein diaphanous homolog 1-like isoform X4 [Panicum virgatum]|uniref:CID domain-containing protein n=2 Tax=Panicum virgatum TaxID=38727 RepID=A0A8T0SA02_PANVG|nr:protein diaphanous homolog 1-like isoform X4 [Panicum virgatum]XP_039808636.1 protein diaphanous homolog 1-like isoform X4 [Panicum virgatum]KAG2593975.1 hypothetical protein PVAP13_5NG610700 [Panicum virgatum]
MSAGFNKQILAQKLAKLNSSQQSIETLSHWCVFHHRYCRQVVETWDYEFRVASSERRLSLLYLANDIMQNSRKEGNGYITEFMRVIPAALNEVLTIRDDLGRNVVKRLIDIWEDRKIFDTQGQSLKDDFFRRLKDIRNKLKNPAGELLEKVVSSYKLVLNAPMDEDTLMRKCQAAIINFDELNNNSFLGSSNQSGVEELQQQHSILRNFIEQLKVSESLRVTLIHHLKEAMNEQELKVEQVRGQLQAAQSRYKKAGELCRGLGIDMERHQPSNQGLKSCLSETPASIAPDSANTKSLLRGQSSAVLYSQEGNGAGHNAVASNVLTKLSVGAVSEKISDSVLPSRANGGNTAVKIDEHSSGNKRQKQEDDTHISQPQSESPPPPPPFPHPDAFQPPPPPEYPPSPEPSPPFQPPPPEYPPSPEPSPPPPPTSMPPHIIPPPPPATMPPQMISALPPTAGTFVPFPAGPPGPMYATFPFTPVVNFPMNIPPGFQSPATPPPAFQGLSGTFYGPATFPTAPPPTDKK